MKRAYLSLLTILISFIVFAQEKSTEVDVTLNKDSGGGGNWYASPWVWIVGAAVFILLLVALTSSGRSKTTTGSSDRVTVTKTVKRDTDV